MYEHPTAKQLLAKLTIYFIIFIGGVSYVLVSNPDTLRWLPFGGADAIEMARIDLGILDPAAPPATQIEEARPDVVALSSKRWLVLAYLSTALLGTILVMLPIAWTYSATRYNAGYRKTFVRALFVLPLCATTIVLLIHDSLALAFGLAALVAAVRFRVALQEPIDGVYVFAAICVGLAAGIGYLGVAAVLSVFFCYANAIFWMIDYGRNPLDDAREQNAKDKLKF